MTQKWVTWYKMGHIYYIKWVTTEYVLQWGTKVGHICFYLILSIQFYRFGARQTEITLVELWDIGEDNLTPMLMLK